MPLGIRIFWRHRYPSTWKRIGAYIRNKNKISSIQSFLKLEYITQFWVKILTLPAAKPSLLGQTQDHWTKEELHLSHLSAKDNAATRNSSREMLPTQDDELVRVPLSNTIARKPEIRHAYKNEQTLQEPDRQPEIAICSYTITDPY